MPGVLKRVGRYDLTQVIGRGGAAVVYLAQQRDLQRDVALKELAPYLTADTSFAERFVEESRLAGSMNHPNVVTVHEYFEDGGVPYIAMEYLPHGSLRQYIGQLTISQIAGVLEGVLAGLSHGESHGIVHRDLKPENLLVAGDGRVKIADFGVARAYNKAVTRAVVTVVGTTIGTPGYMSPEQAMGYDLTPASDLYSLGLVAWEMLTGQIPFEESETPVAVLYRQVHETIPSVRTLAPEVDPTLAAWLDQMLAKQPENRFATADDAWEQLEEVVLDLLGPRWRREARVVVGDRGRRRERTLTPASFRPGNAAVLTPPPAGDQPSEPVESAPAPAEAGLPAVNTEPPAVNTEPPAVETEPPAPSPGAFTLAEAAAAQAQLVPPVVEPPAAEPPAAEPLEPQRRLVPETIGDLPAAPETIAPKAGPRRNFTTQHRIPRRHLAGGGAGLPAAPNPGRRRLTVAAIVVAMIVAAGLGAVLGAPGAKKAPVHTGPTAAEILRENKQTEADDKLKVAAARSADKQLSTLLADFAQPRQFALTKLLAAKTPTAQAKAAKSLASAYASLAMKTAVLAGKTTQATPLTDTLKSIATAYKQLASAATSKSASKLNAARDAVQSGEKTLVTEVGSL